MTREEFYYQCIDVIEHWLNGNRKLSDLREVTDKLYNEVTRPHWISVEDELPRDEQHTATINKAGFQAVRYYKGGKWFSSYGNEYGDITHWMPLPQAPSSSENRTTARKEVRNETRRKIRTLLQQGYNAGCVKGYEESIDKACEWMDRYIDNYLFVDMEDAPGIRREDFINDFRQVMKGE